MPISEKKVSTRSSFFRGAADRIGRTEFGLRMLKVLSKNRPSTLLTEEALFTIYQTANGVRGVTGDVAEVGVYQGGTAWLLGSIFRDSDRNVLLFDTFEGMPDSAGRIFPADLRLRSIYAPDSALCGNWHE